MATEVTLPALGESVTEGTVTRWLKQVGDQIAIDEPLLEVSTDKVDTEIPSPVAGTLLEIKAAEDDTVEVGAVLAVIGEAGEAPAEAPAAPAEEAPA
ncbi:biotin/lipoyl-containing protein, partial [Nocardioides sp. GCM10030258]